MQIFYIIQNLQLSNFCRVSLTSITHNQIWKSSPNKRWGSPKSYLKLVTAKSLKWNLPKSMVLVFDFTALCKNDQRNYLKTEISSDFFWSIQNRIIHVVWFDACCLLAMLCSQAYEASECAFLLSVWSSVASLYPAGNYMFKVNYRKTKTRC